VPYSSKKCGLQRVTIRLKERASVATLKAQVDDAYKTPPNMAGAGL